MQRGEIRRIAITHRVRTRRRARSRSRACRSRSVRRSGSGRVGRACHVRAISIILTLLLRESITLTIRCIRKRHRVRRLLLCSSLVNLDGADLPIRILERGRVARDKLLAGWSLGFARRRSIPDFLLAGPIAAKRRINDELLIAESRAIIAAVAAELGDGLDGGPRGGVGCTGHEVGGDSGVREHPDLDARGVPEGGVDAAASCIEGMTSGGMRDHLLVVGVVGLRSIDLNATPRIRARRDVAVGSNLLADELLRVEIRCAAGTRMKCHRVELVIIDALDDIDFPWFGQSGPTNHSAGQLPQAPCGEWRTSATKSPPWDHVCSEEIRTEARPAVGLTVV